MADTPPKKAPRRKPGKPMRFPERVLAHVTLETKQQLQAVADRKQLQVPDIIREYIRAGLERDTAPDAPTFICGPAEIGLSE